jgi:hypothetical protein
MQKSLKAKKPLQFDHIAGLGAFLAFDNIELDLLTLGEAFKAFGLNNGKMHENIWTVFLFDKTESLGIIEPLHHTLSHCRLSFDLALAQSLARFRRHRHGTVMPAARPTSRNGQHDLNFINTTSLT